MPTTKRSKGGRAATSRAKTTARGRGTRSAKATSKTKAAPRAVAKAKPVAKAKSSAKAKPRVVKSTKATLAKTKSVAAKGKAATASKPSQAAPEINREVVTLKAKFQRERNGLEKRLTNAVREIGLLRHHELRSMQFERQLGERDVTIERLQRQLSEMERRPSEPAYARELQQSLALGAPPHHSSGASADADGADVGLEAISAEMEHSAADLEEASADLDEFEDERLAEDADLVTDDD